jgi:hypothetical protein
MNILNMSSLVSSIIVAGFLLFQFQYSYGTNTGDDRIELDNILAKYWSWWSNSPEDQPENNPKCSMGIDTEDSFVFYINPFEIGDVAYDCTDQPIPKGYSIMFPLLISFCSQGDKGLYNKPYQEIRDCALDLDRGKIKGIVSIDDKVIVNLQKDNGNGIDMKPNSTNSLLQSKYYKEIFPTNFVNILASSNTTFTNNWEKPEEFKNSPIYYKAVEHCDCVIIDTNELNPGNHTLKYIVDSVGGESSNNAADKGWKFISTAEYRFAVK